MRRAGHTFGERVDNHLLDDPLCALAECLEVGVSFEHSEHVMAALDHMEQIGHVRRRRRRARIRCHHRRMTVATAAVDQSGKVGFHNYAALTVVIIHPPQ